MYKEMQKMYNILNWKFANKNRKIYEMFSLLIYEEKGIWKVSNNSIIRYRGAKCLKPQFYILIKDDSLGLGSNWFL